MIEENNDNARVTLWNPGAVCNWSILLTGAFGAILQYKNWRLLGEVGESKKSLYWAIFSIAFFLVWAVIPEAYEPFPVITRRFQFIVFVIWYFAHGVKQVRYVKERFGKNYDRKKWAVPIISAIGCIIFYVVYTGVMQIFIELMLVDLPVS